MKTEIKQILFRGIAVLCVLALGIPAFESISQITRAPSLFKYQPDSFIGHYRVGLAVAITAFPMIVAYLIAEHRGIHGLKKYAISLVSIAFLPVTTIIFLATAGSVGGAGAAGFSLLFFAVIIFIISMPVVLGLLSLSGIKHTPITLLTISLLGVIFTVDEYVNSFAYEQNQHISKHGAVNAVISGDLFSKMPSRENTVSFDLLNERVLRKKDASVNANTPGWYNPLKDITVVCNRENIKRKNSRVRFDWSIMVNVKDGGLIEIDTGKNINKILMAPDTGYQPAWSQTMKKSSDKWIAESRHNFIIKLRNGKYFGKMYMTFDPYYGHKKPECGISLRYSINRSKTKNLYFE